MSSGFVHLHLHSEYSLANGTVRIKPLVKVVAQQGMPAVAITDQSNLFAMVKFYRAAMAAGVKPIIGADLWVQDERERAPPSRLVLLCRNRDGYRNLTRLISRAYLEGQHRGHPAVAKSWLAGSTAGLIALSGARAGDIGQALVANKPDEARRLSDEYLAFFPDAFYLELQRTGRSGEDEYLHATLDLAVAAGLPVVATNDVHFLRREDFEAHEARVCIHDGRTLDDPRRPRQFSPEQYLRTPEEMAELFADLPQALENSVEIAKRCNLELDLGTNVLPDFPVPAGLTLADHLREQAHDGLRRRLAQGPTAAAADSEARRQAYEQRLERELEVIIQMGFSGYFLIVADFIKWAKTNGIPVGPGRGSGAGSLVAYALTITDLDPLVYDLLFERFLNPERVSMPDFDVDFCMEGRDRVIDYVAERYGRDHVSQIITYGSMAAKAVVRDVGRVLGYPYGYVDRIAKLIPFEIGMTLNKAIEQEEALRELYDQDDEVRAIIDMAKSLEGLARNAGKHAGGVVIAPSPLTDFTPLYCEQGGQSVVTQFDKDDVEAIGLVKFDFLGLRTLTIIDWALDAINAQRATGGEAAIDIAQIPLDDVQTFTLLKSCTTTAVFQLESRGMKDLIKRLQPDCFEDIVALVALFRPGPLQSGMVDDFINRKHGRAKVEYPHPALEPILKGTYGVILYQEQVMQIAQELAGYTLGGADLLRRAMGKKKPEEMAKQRAIFTDGAVERGVHQATATHIFDLMEKFAGYGFNKSHSAAYALVSYQTAWLKAHYPAAFMAAVLSADMDNTDKVVTLIDECRDMKLAVEPPDVNRCCLRFAVKDEQAILYGLGAIKGVGASAIDAMMSEREHGGPYGDLFDLCRRIDTRKANRRVIEALIMAGALDGFGENRATLMATLPEALQFADQQARNQVVGQDDLFGIGEVLHEGEYRRHPDWDDEQRLAAEKQTLGLYLTGHPIERYLPELKNIVTARIVDLKPTRDQSVTVAGLIVAMRTMNTKRGDRMAFITIDDRSARIELAVFSDIFQRHRDLLAKDRLIVVEGEVSVDEYSGGYRMSAREIHGIEDARARFGKRLVIQVDASKAGNGFVAALASTLGPFREGHCPVELAYRGQGAKANLMLGDEWRVHPSDELLHRLGELAGRDNINVLY
ncbi:MAG: DNA polymerase III subunit alpha [Thiotrichales bacterium SG8_50]|nr:MAG: DNA polymerase III subunit alpha [Thiotrichales bacterium SG8_50]